MRLLTILFFLTAFLQVNAQSFNDITIKKDRANLETVFLEIEKQSDFRFFFNETLMKQAVPVTIDVKKVSLNKALEACFGPQPALTYAIVEKTIIVKRREMRQSELSMGGKDFGKLAELRGIVASEKGTVAAATVTVKGTDKVTATNTSGEFLLYDVEDNALLVVSHVAYEAQEVRLNGRGLINITLSEKVSELDEQIVVAYTTTTRKNNVGAVTIVKGEQIQNLPNRSFEKSLQGLVPGLLVTKGNGQPGSAPGNFILRGIATGGAPSAWQSFRNPLVVVDGVPVYQDPLATSISSVGSPAGNPMSQLNPSDIETITVLKDAAAIALYGSKASNGVILVTTKKGKAGKTRFNFRNQTDITERLKDPAVLNQQEYLELLFEAYRNSLGYSEAEFLADLRTSPPNELTTSPYFPHIVNSLGDTSFYPAQDWNGAFYNKAAITLANELSISGGNDRSNFYLNLEYTKQNGVIRKTDFDRKSLRFNYENRIAHWLKLGLNSTASYSVQNYTMGSQNVLMTSPLLPIRLNDGNYLYNYSWGLGYDGSNFISNPIASAELDINRNVSYRALNKLYAELKFLKNFTLTSNVGVDFILAENKQKIHPQFVLMYESEPGTGSITDILIRNANIITTNTLRYDKLLGKSHNINLLLGQEAQIFSNKLSFTEQRGFGTNPDATEPTSGNVFNAFSSIEKQTLLSYFGQANYMFRNKYFLTGSIRTDGSSRFGENKRFGTYWSLGTGWIVTEEAFMQKLNSWLNYLKFRGSIGSSGNSAAISSLLQYDQLRFTNYLGNIAVLPNRDFPGNPAIQWESTFSWDAGVELSFLKKRVAITADIYSRKTKELIANSIVLAPTTGYISIADNVGDLKNSGVELSLSADLLHSKDFQWNLTANWSMNENKLTRSAFPQSGAGGVHLINMVGEAYNSFYLREWAGVNPDNGRPTWRDSSGKISEDYYAAKQSIAGKTQPDGFGSVKTTITYKSFEISAMVYYQYGFQIYLPDLLQNDGMNPYINQSKAALNRWQKPGDIAANPRRLLYGMAGSDFDMGSYASTRYLYDGDFIRLSNISLAYSFPKRMLDRLNVSMLKVFVQGNNLKTWTKYSGQDPENIGAGGEGNFLYPQQRSYSLGLNLNF